ncbi:MAG: phosphoglucosamine mutase [Acidobacteriota bacterium]
MSQRLFGTDGMRGVAFTPPLDRVTVTRLGAALATHLRDQGRPPRVLLAGDTRASTPPLAEWVGGSLIAAGGEVAWAGVLPTPAVSHLLREEGGYGAGVVVSASHNPAPDNGIKLVGPDGAKWPITEEACLEARLLGLAGEQRVASLPSAEPRFARRYLGWLGASLPERPLSGLKLVVDAANGAASPVVEEFFASLGAVTTVIHARPDGVNINAGCGALHPEVLAASVLATGANAGVAFDGDADRAVLVAADGRVLDGDDVLLLWARELARRGALAKRVVIATVMSNLGLELTLENEGIKLIRCPVGDREVWDAMRREGAVLGGEQSGHVICSLLSVTGDGLLTAAHVLAVACRLGLPLADLSDLQRLPQVLLNVRVARRTPLDQVPELRAAISEAEGKLGRSGRVFVRYSGTEPLLRIMVEAAARDQATATAELLGGVAVRHLGSPAT